MIYSHEVENMCTVAKGPKNGPAPIPVEGKWVKAYDVKDISGLTHGVGWCAPQQELVINLKCKRRYYRRGSCRNGRLFRYDTLCCNGK